MTITHTPDFTIPRGGDKTPEKGFIEQKSSFKDKLQKFFDRKSHSSEKTKSSGKHRGFYINDNERNTLGPKTEPNYLKTTKYTFWNFVPLSLMY